MAMLKKVHTWRWRYRDPRRGARRRAVESTSDGVSKPVPDADRIESTRLVREGHDDFADTQPRVFRPDDESD